VSTVAKAVELMNFFSAECAELRLADFQRLTGRDKTTTYRHLTALTQSGLLEQDAVSRAYKMGPAVLKFAHVRELTVPRRAGVRSILPKLADVSGETAHASILQGEMLVTLADHTSDRHSIRVVLDDAVLPLHATASGMAVLAYSGDALIQKACENLTAFTEKTVTSRDRLEEQLDRVRSSGFGELDSGLEFGVSGIAVPLFDSTQSVSGAVGVASLTSRVTSELVRTIKRLRN